MYPSGIGLAISKHLLSLPEKHNVILVARTTPSALTQLESGHRGRVKLVTADFVDLTSAQLVLDSSTSAFGSLDGLIVNHGILGEVQRVTNSTVDGWRQTFDVNFFSVVGIVQAALPALRESKGRIIFTSSGAAQNAYSTWGAYGASKAALNHLAMTLKNEEPDVTTVSIRPGVVDSDMQKEIREVHHTTMDEKDREKFLEAKEKGKLLRPEQPGNVIARLAIAAPKVLSGKFLSWDDETLKEFQD